MGEQEREPKTREQELAELQEIVKRFTSPESDAEMDANIDKRNAMVEEFRKKHPENWQNYILQHILVGGSTILPSTTEWDTPDHELEKLIRSLPEIE